MSEDHLAQCLVHGASPVRDGNHCDLQPYCEAPSIIQGYRIACQDPRLVPKISCKGI